MAGIIWKGNISFGLVNIPVTLRTAETRNEIDFTLLDNRDLSPIGYKKVSKKSGREVPKGAVVRGFEYEEGQYVIVTDADLKRAAVERTQTVEIVAFVDRDEIAPSYFDRPYYLEPAPKSKKPYALLREALKATGKVGVAKVVIRTREYLAAVIASEQVIILDLLRFAHELSDSKELELPPATAKGAGVAEKELKMAIRLIDEMVEPWDPSKFRDEYHDELLEFIERKARTGEVEPIEAPAKSTARRSEVIDMVSLLEQSLTRRGKAREPEKRRAPRAASKSAGRSAPRRKSATRKGDARVKQSA
jgi:DNA end-binding protein Ku